MIALATINADESREIAAALDKKFHQLKKLTQAVAGGFINAAVIHGRGGIGKTWTVEETLEALKEDSKIQVHTLTGHVSPLQLYTNLLEHSSANSIHLLDDVDSAITEIASLNILKAATDTKKERWIHWASTSSKVKETEFLFHGKLILITNHDLTATAHYRAFMDRVASMNMTLSQKETMVRIAQLASKSPKKELKMATAVVGWIEKNLSQFHGNNLSMRVFEKAMGFARFDDEWPSLAEAAILREQLQ